MTTARKDPWKHGLPPRDDRTYEVMQRTENAGGYLVTIQYYHSVRWLDGGLVRTSLMHGGPVPIVLTNRWRVAEMKGN